MSTVDNKDDTQLRVLKALKDAHTVIKQLEDHVGELRSSATDENAELEELLNGKEQELLNKHMELKDAQMAIKQLEEHLSKVGTDRHVSEQHSSMKAKTDLECHLHITQQQLLNTYLELIEHSPTLKATQQELQNSKHRNAEMQNLVAKLKCELSSVQGASNEKDVHMRQLNEKLFKLQQESGALQVRNEQLQQLELSQTAAEQAQEEAESQLERIQQVADTEAKARKDLEYCLHEKDQELINQQLQLRDAKTAIEAVE